MEKLTNHTENSEAREYIPSTESVCHFLNLTPESLEKLRSRLEGAQGHLRIWVHPFYTEQLPSSIGNRRGDYNLNEIQDKLREAFYKTNESVVRNLASSPLVVYEPKIHLSKTKELIATHLNCAPSELEARGIIFIPTERDTSLPDKKHFIESLQAGDERDNMIADNILTFRDAVSQLSEYGETLIPKLHAKLPQLKEDPYSILTEEEKKWQLEILKTHEAGRASLTERYKEARELEMVESSSVALSALQQLGMRSALVSGAYLEVQKNSRTGEDRFSACAGAIVNQLRDNGIPTDISANIWPPKNLIREAGFEIKQTSKETTLE